MDDAKPGSLGALVDKVEKRVDAGEKISIGMIQKVAGQRAAGPMLLFPALRKAAPGDLVVADGTSCRHQIHDGLGIDAEHVVRVLDRALMPRH